MEVRIVEQRAVVQAGAFAPGGGLKPVAHDLGALEQLLDLGQLPDGQLVKPLDRRLVIRGGGQQVPDLVKGRPARCPVSIIARVRTVSGP